MRHIGNTLMFALIAIFVIAINEPFAIERPLKTEEAKVTDVAGSFTLVLYGGRHFNDVETIAFLDVEGDQYTFEPYAPEFDYRVEKGLSAKVAIERAEKFVGWHPAFWRSQLSKVLDSKGKTIGYELRPFYYPLAFGDSDVFDVDYRIRDGKVIVYIRLKPSVERQLFDGDGLKGRDNGR